MSRKPCIGVLELGAKETYLSAIRYAGGQDTLLENGLEEDEYRRRIAELDGLMLTGGGDVNPSLYGSTRKSETQGVNNGRDRDETLLCHLALERKVPLLGICRGIQVLNVACGGSLIQDIASEVPNALPHNQDEDRSKPTHPVILEDGSRLFQLIGIAEIEANSMHHQAVSKLGKDCIVTAHAPDGVIEAIEIRDHPFAIGVQWHPEEMYQSIVHSRRLLKAFIVTATEEGTKRRPSELLGRRKRNLHPSDNGCE